MKAPTLFAIQCGQTKAKRFEILTSFLKKKNIPVASRLPKEPMEMPVLFYVRNWSEEASDRIRAITTNGSTRLLVVSDGSPTTLGEIVSMLRSGASDVIHLHEGNTGLSATASAIISRLHRWDEIDRAIRCPRVSETLIGQSKVWLQALRNLAEIAVFGKGSVLITGESGTGKELAARMIHDLDPSVGGKKLVLLDCTTIVPELSGSEFFGHERGAFTGAMSSRDGAFARAEGGTLFLDEIGELPPRLQTELLRISQEKTYKRVGGDTWRKTSFRLICATNRQIERAGGSFRDDLYHRIASLHCHLPPLRDRCEDIPLLMTHFLREFLGDPPPDVDPVALEFLISLPFLGNVRELRQICHRMATFYTGSGPITVGTMLDKILKTEPSPRPVPSSLRACVRKLLAEGNGLKEIVNRVSNQTYRTALEEEGGDTMGASVKLKQSRRAVQYWLERQKPRSAQAMGSSGGSRAKPVAD